MKRRHAIPGKYKGAFNSYSRIERGKRRKISERSDKKHYLKREGHHRLRKEYGRSHHEHGGGHNYRDRHTHNHEHHRHENGHHLRLGLCCNFLYFLRIFLLLSNFFYESEFFINFHFLYQIWGLMIQNNNFLGKNI